MPPEPRLDDAFFRRQAVPVSIQVGAQAAVAITRSNAGDTTWDPASGYALGSQNPQDNLNWGIGRVPVPGPVHPGEDVTFEFTITAPTAGLSTPFEWAMLQEGVQWFGTPTDSLTIQSVPPGEPAGCDRIRTDIRRIDAKIASLQDDLGRGLHEDARIRKQITELQGDRGQLTNRGRNRGCVV